MAAIAVLLALLAPGAKLEVEGTCPEREALSRALEQSLDLAVTAPVYTVRVWRGDAGRSRLELLAPDGGRLLDRVVASDDCDALAQAFAAMIETHFARLHLPPAAQTIERTAPAPTRRRFVLSIAAAGGVAVGLDPSDAAGFGQLDLSIARSASGFVLRLGGATGAATEQRMAADRVERRETSVRVGAGYRLARGDWWIEPGAGLALVVASVTALDLMGTPSVTRATPAVELALGAARRLSGPWSLRAEAATRLFPLADRYLIDGVGAVGRSPRASLSAALGVQADFDW